MLSMSAMSGGQASYYLGLAREDYYLEGGEPPGQWYGEGASKLGLHGEVEAAHLYNLFGGYSHEGDRPLVQLQSHDEKATHRPGWDLTFQLPNRSPRFGHSSARRTGRRSRRRTSKR